LKDLLSCIFLIHLVGFNYAYRRTATPSTVAPTPNSTTSALPSNPPTQGSTPAPDRALPPHLTNTKSSASTTPPQATTSGRETPKETPASNPTTAKPNGAPAAPGTSEKAEREKAKKKEKKERKDRERAEREAAAKENTTAPADDKKEVAAVTSGKATPEASTSTEIPDTGTDPKSPTTESASGGIRTPTTRKPTRNPWTIFMRMNVPATEAELREFFGEAAKGVS
jgi:hypothetical protein